MYKLCKTKQSAEQQTHIAQCLLEMLRERPYAQVTVSALCERAGVPRKTFYRYFESKDDVLDAVVDKLLAMYGGFSAGPEAEGAPSPEAELTRYFLFWKNNRALLDSMRRSSIVELMISRTVTRLCEGMTWTSRLTRAGVDSERRTAMLFTIVGLFAVMLEWANRGFDRDARELAAETAKILTRPMVS